MRGYTTAFFSAFSAVLLTALPGSSQTFSVRSAQRLPLRALYDSRNKLELYLIYGSVGLTLDYTAPQGDASTHHWFRYRQGVASAEPVAASQHGATSTLLNPLPGYGYFVGLPSHPATHYLYLIDYATLIPDLSSFSFLDDPAEHCSNLAFAVDGSLPKILYYTPASLVPAELKRSFTLSYRTLQWDDEHKVFQPRTVQESFNDPFAISITPPLCDTEFRLSGDSFAAHFGLAIDLISPLFSASAVQAHADTLLLAPADPPNLYTASQGLSAPASLRFSAYANDPVAFLYLWTIFREGEADNPLLRFTGKQIDYTFNTAGRYTATLDVANRDGSCNDDSQRFTFEVAETFIDIPNAFSPGASPGVNDEFRIVYKSITHFQGSIFNRWGNRLFFWNDPARGWDGRVNGQLAPAGTYFFVIEYLDAQGRPKKHTGPLHLFN
ncbi:MAG: gliding motility-associated C-terminal domain-containing protein [Tannerellaceae bacterium]|jgi:gliding motility-associated-like protein|nr:gliding motility-associated C-terminal domain-containing protein [Tannerellaceae bacterium]